jgi:hypothetical protein
MGKIYKPQYQKLGTGKNRTTIVNNTTLTHLLEDFIAKIIESILNKYNKYFDMADKFTTVS